ncbi:MAG TPA: MarC family protein [Bacteroidota bacterium]
MNNVAEVLSGVGVAVVTLLLIITPVSMAVFHSSICAHFNKSEWNRQILRSCLYLTAILVVFLVAGHFVMVATILPTLKSGLRRNDCTIPRIQDDVPDDGETTGAGNEGTTVVIEVEGL